MARLANLRTPCASILIVSALFGGRAQAEPPNSAAASPPPAQAPTAASAPAAGTQLQLDSTLQEAPAGAEVPPTAANPGQVLRPRAAPVEPGAAPLASVARPISIDDNPLFPRYSSLEPRVAFWTRIFGQYSELQSAIHSSEYPDKVYEVLDFRGDAVQLNRFALDKLRRDEEERAKARVETLLAGVNAKRATPELMTYDERRIYDLYADIDDPDKFEKAMGTTRAQRGLRERTQAALETSGKYLPEMERIFRGYGLPVRLTRLPLVESSFNVEAYSKVGAAGLWQFMPSSAKIYMRLNNLVDDRRDPWFSTEAAARHLRDDYAALGSWPLALTAYNHGRGGIARGLSTTGAHNLAELVQLYKGKSFGFASKNFYTEFLAASEVERNYQMHFGEVQREMPLEFEVVETRNYVPYDTLRRLCGASDELFQKLNPSYRPEVIEGKLFVPPGHLIRVPAGSARGFEIGYAKLGSHERFDAQRVQFLLHRVRRGDTLASVARRYGVSATVVASANGLGSKQKLRLGQVIKVPPHAEPRPGPVTLAIGESTPRQTREQRLAEAAEARRPAGKRKAEAVRGQRKAPAAKKSKPAPKARIHQVSGGQTLTAIARQYGISVTELRAANQLGGNSVIKPGMKLKIPDKT